MRRQAKPCSRAQQICPAVTGEQLPLTAAITGTGPACGKPDSREIQPRARQ
jgi:hypothetical protein